MPIYHYQGFTDDGVKISGTVDAESPAAAEIALRNQKPKINPIRVQAARNYRVTSFGSRAPNLKDKAFFTQQFAQLLGSNNLPQIEALDIASRSTTNPRMKAAILKVREQIQLGHHIEDVFAAKEFQGIFDPVFVAFIRMGVQQGNIVPPLRELAEMYKWNLKMTGLMRKALTLPLIITLACVAATYFIMSRVVPTFMDILNSIHADLPPITLAVKNASDFMTSWPFAVISIAIITALIYSQTALRKSEQGRYFTDRVALRLPVIGKLLRTYILARISRAVSVMLRNDISIVTALDIASQVAGNEVYRRHLLTMKEAAVRGQSLSQLMFSSADFPDDYRLQFRAAEENGGLKEILRYLAEIYHDQVATDVEGLTTVIEPALIAFLGTVVITIVLAVFMPLTTMINTLQR